MICPLPSVESAGDLTFARPIHQECQLSEELTVTDVKVVNLRTVKHVGKRDVVSTGVVYGLEVGTCSAHGRCLQS